MKLKEYDKLFNFKNKLKEYPLGSICQDHDGAIYLFKEGKPKWHTTRQVWVSNYSYERIVDKYTLSEDFDSKILTFQDFEPSYWDGVVDLEVGHILEVWHDDDWKEVTVDYIKGDFVVVLDGLQNAEKFSWSNNEWKKAMTPEEKKAEEERRKAVFKMLHLYTGYSIYSDSTSYNTEDVEDMSRVYDAIKRGDIKID